MNNKFTKSLLYTYTFIVIAISIFISFGVVRNTDRAVLADECPALPEFDTIMGCTTSCHQGCNGNSQCVDGCYNACVNICQGGSNPATCGVDPVCNAPGENAVNCPSDCGGNTGGGDNDGNNDYIEGGYIGTIGTESGSCPTGEWQLYECAPPLACTTYLQGCNPTTSEITQVIMSDAEVTTWLDETPTCAVRQADCKKTSGVNLVFRSRINCPADCYPTQSEIPNPPNPDNPVVIPPTDNTPEDEPINVLCNDTCNTTNRLCPSNLSCIPVDGVNRCRLPSNPTSPTCEPPVIVTNPNYTIDKILEGNFSYTVGQIATFRVRLTNTGDTTLTNVKFRDVYSTTFLTFSGGSAVKSTGGSIDNISTYLTRNNNGILEIENILSSNVLGSLVPNAYIDVTLKFVTKAPINQTCNFAYIDAPDLVEINDSACLGTTNVNTDI